MKRSPNTEFFEDGLKSGTFWKRRFPVLVWTPIFLKTETCEQGLSHVCRFLLLKMFQKFLFFCDLPRAFLDRVGKLLKLIFRHYSQIFRHYVCVITPKLSTCIFRWLSSFIVVSFEGVLHSEVAFTPNFSFGSILCSCEFCILANFAFGQVLHSGEFCIRACFAFRRVLHSGEFCIWASFVFERVLHSGVFCIRTCFAYWRVLHSGEFCIRASFAFGQVLYSGVFCIWAGFAFGRVLHSSIPYSLANRNTRDVQRLYVLKYGEYGKSAKSALMHQLSHLNRL